MSPWSSVIIESLLIVESSHGAADSKPGDLYNEITWEPEGGWHAASHFPVSLAIPPDPPVMRYVLGPVVADDVDSELVFAVCSLGASVMAALTIAPYPSLLSSVAAAMGPWAGTVGGLSLASISHRPAGSSSDTTRKRPPTALLAIADGES